jgi:rubrerythrin
MFVHIEIRGATSYRLTYLKQSSGTDRCRHVCKFQCIYIETDKPAAGPCPSCRVQVPHANLPDRLRVKTHILK